MASPNTLTNLIPTLYAALDIVSREQIGFIPAVTRDSTCDRVALNQSVNVPIVGKITPVSISPGSYAPDTGGATPGNVAVTISNQYAAPIAWNGDEQIATTETGIYASVVTQRFAQAMRAVANLVENDLGALHINASRAAGTYNVQPFATANDFSDMSAALQILEDNGAPTTDLHSVLSTTAIANIRGKQSVLFKVNEAGTADMLRRGIIGDILGVALHASAGVRRAVTVGTSNNAGTTDTTGYPVGTTSITMASAGSGTIIPGDIVTFAGDSNQYVATTTVAALGSGGTLGLAAPGLMKAVAASNVVVTVIAATDRNMLFSRNAIVLATRMPYMPEGGDMADDVIDLVDPISGLTFQVAMYRQYRQVHFEVGLAWGVKCIKPEHAVIVMG